MGALPRVLTSSSVFAGGLCRLDDLSGVLVATGLSSGCRFVVLVTLVSFKRLPSDGVSLFPEWKLYLVVKACAVAS